VFRLGYTFSRALQGTAIGSIPVTTESLALRPRPHISADAAWASFKHLYLAPVRLGLQQGKPWENERWGQASY